MDDFEEYLSAHWDDLYRLARLIAGVDTNVDDLMQEAVVKMMRSWPRLRSATRQRPYARRIIVNAAIDLAHHTRRQRDSDALLATPMPGLGAGQHGSGDLWELVVALPPRQRAIVVLRYYEDLSEREIAHALGCRPGTVKSQSSAALKTLSSRYAMRSALEAGS